MPTQEFYVVCPPGLEDILDSEIKTWFPTVETKAGHGGVTVNCDLATGLALNQVLKTATRVLLRVAQFTCRDFPKLYKKIAGFKWTELVDLTCSVKVHASAARSRLKIKSRIEETSAEGWASAQKAAGLKPSSDRQIDLYVRMVDNMCTLSLDTSGERLHKRGSRALIGEAPLRESFAAALLQILKRHSQQDDPVELVDPMMGAGTFLLEALSSHEPTVQRDFAFENFKVPPASLPDMPPPTPAIHSVVGYELDYKTIKAASQNLNSVNAKVELYDQDFFQAENLPPGVRRWLITNPPYGERLKVEEPLEQFYTKLFQACEKIARPELSCFLLPASSGRLELPHNWKVQEKRRLSNGGIAVIAYIFRRSGPP